MNIKIELLREYVAETVTNQIEEICFDASEIADTTATKILCEVQEVLKNDTLSDFEIVEEIVCIFEKYKIDFGACHDF